MTYHTMIPCDVMLCIFLHIECCVVPSGSTVVVSPQVQRALLLLHEMRSLGVPRNAVVYGHIINCFCSKVREGKWREGKVREVKKKEGKGGKGR